MSDLQLAKYILKVANKGNWRDSSTWTLSRNPRLGKGLNTFTICSGTMYTQTLYSIRLLRTWINNPAAAQAYLTADETTSLRIMIAQYFLEHGV
jgi:hypothetical protein